MDLLFDTNIFIYHLNNQLPPSGKTILKLGLAGQGAYSVISKIELLGFQQSQAADRQAQQILSRLAELPLTADVAERTIHLRKQLRIKVPDAIIAATALEYSLQFVTRNTTDFAKLRP
ncbi:MAG: type II toxin-antitoxin system VapC family toxin [Tildeniella torsiva UHER 1998/13D]|nr:type II toxin-antitoxin system VapC family toxin [Tildeniella torsiva UHER 1998/13D]